MHFIVTDDKTLSPVDIQTITPTTIEVITPTGFYHPHRTLGALVSGAESNQAHYLVYIPPGRFRAGDALILQREPD